MSDGRFLMGTVLEITIATRDEEEARRALDEAFATARQLETLFSRYDPESQVSQLNANAGGELLRVDARLHAALRSAAAYNDLTGGAFDVTIGPLVELWTEAGRRGRAPSVEELAQAKLRVGADRLRLSDDGSVALPAPGMSIDLGGLGKGIALDRALSRLLHHGFEDVLLSFGQSSTWAHGSPPEHDGWRLLLRAPEEGFLGVVTLRDQAFSVSSSLARSTVIEGRRYGHVIDPRTGEALTQRRQAAVVSRDGTLAEILSTALLILDETEGILLVDSLDGTEALLIDERGRASTSRGWYDATGFTPVEPPPSESLPDSPRPAP